MDGRQSEAGHQTTSDRTGDCPCGCFDTSIPKADFGLVEKLLHVTYKYREGSTSPWIWVETQQGTKPARILLQPSQKDSDQSLAHLLDLSPDWNTIQLEGSNKSLKLFKLESKATIPRSLNSERENELSEHVLGRVNNQIQYMALVRFAPYWICPRQGRDYFHLEEDAVLCSFLVGIGKVITILTTTGADDVYSVIRSNDNGGIAIAARCDSEQDVAFHCFIAVANTMEESISAVMGAARDAVNSQPEYQQLATDPSMTDHQRSSIESWYDGLTFCTWNALGQDLSEAKILGGLSSLAENDIKIATLLIDDNWQILGPIPDFAYDNSFHRGWKEMKVNSAVAPEGLLALTSKIKSLHPNVTDIGVWHALLGYWGGISPTGQISDDYDTVKAPTSLLFNIPTTITSIAHGDLQRFYNDLYTYLSDSGVAFVKTDVQHMLSMFRSSKSRSSLIPAYRSAWTNSCAKHFGGKAISCMSLIPELLFTNLLQSIGPRVMIRNSDDFFPEIVASHSWHIWANAHNALLTQHLNALPDWDMFQTSHPYSSYHAAARCISGGPITITDVPGTHDIALLKQITALDPSGRSIALRPNVAKVVGGFNEYMQGNILEIGTTTQSGYSMLGLWNIAEATTSTLVPLSDFPTPEKLGSEVVVYNYSTRQILGRYDATEISSQKGNSAVNLIASELGVREWEILTACPLQSIRMGTIDMSIAILGLTDKMSGAAAVVDVSEPASGDNGLVEMTIKVKAVGVLSLCIYIPQETTPSVHVEIPGQASEIVETEVKRIKEADSSSMGQETWLVSADLESLWHEKKLFSSGTDSIEIRISVGV